jgi:Ras-related protein Rab-5C
MFSLATPKSYKIVLLGDTGVGKSSIASQYTKGDFNHYQEPTIGAAFMCKQCEIQFEGTRVSCKFEIWDTAGQERYKSLAPMYYRGAQIALVVYDITSEDSLKGAKFWLEELENKGPEDIYKILVGNKMDLEEDRKVSHDAIFEIASKFNCMHRYVSAKDSKRVSNLFETAGRQALLKFPNPNTTRVSRTSETLSASSAQPQSSCC